MEHVNHHDRRNRRGTNSPKGVTPPQFAATLWLPGESPNPAGRGSVKRRIQAELAGLVEEFVARYGRDPRRLERNDLEQLARMAVELQSQSLRVTTRTLMQLQHRLLKQQYFPGMTPDPEPEPTEQFWPTRKGKR